MQFRLDKYNLVDYVKQGWATYSPWVGSGPQNFGFSHRPMALVLFGS